MISKYSGYNPNEVFFNSLMKERSEIDRDIASSQIKQRIGSILAKLSQLSEDEREEWRDTQLAKLRQLFGRLEEGKGKQRSKALREGLRCLVLVCAGAGIAYNQQQIEKITKATYINEYDKKAFGRFVAAGYSVHDLEVLDYQEPISWKFICCCSIFS